MSDTDKMSTIEPERLTSKSRFQFRCHKGVGCFTQCCRDINIILTPYDIIRLKNRLKLNSQEFLAIYTEPQMLEKTGLPVVTLKLLEEENDRQAPKSCPFVRDEGCIVYEDRPTTCRYYPLGVASMAFKEEEGDDDFYFFVNEPHCLGFDEDTNWTVAEFREDQEADAYDRINAEWTNLVVRKRSFPPNMQWNEKTRQMFFMASYNIDRFREFVFGSSFFDRYDVDQKTRTAIKDDDVALLEFGMKWLKWLLFKVGDFKQKSDAEASD
jgi:hypothetical protein